jgi:hypothetical protein
MLKENENNKGIALFGRLALVSLFSFVVKTQEKIGYEF